MKKDAKTNQTGLYRYSLTRVGGDSKLRVAFIMLNSITADAEVDDPTIRHFVDLARTWACGSVEVVTAFAHRTKESDALGDTADTGSRERCIHDGHRRYCLEETVGGQPRHPLYVRKTVRRRCTGGRAGACADPLHHAFGLKATMLTVPFPGDFFISNSFGRLWMTSLSFLHPYDRGSKSGITRFM